MGLNQTSKFEWRSHVILAVIAALIFLSLSGNLYAAKVTPEGKTPTVVSPKAPEEPKLSEIIPLAAQLSARLTKLKNTKLDLPALVKMEKNYSKIATRIDAASKHFESLQTQLAGQSAREIALKMNFAYENESLNKLNLPLNMAIDQLDSWEQEWQREKQQWKDWRSSSFKDRSFPHILTAFDQADATIDAALDFISQQMEPLLAVQSIGARIKAKADDLDAEIAALRAETLREPLLGKAPPMYTLDYFAQFDRELWTITRDNLKFMPRPGTEFFLLHALELGILAFVLSLIFAVIYRNREAIAESKNWSFVAERPIATMLFVTTLIAMFRMQFWSSPSNMVNAVILTVGSMSCLRLLLKVLQSDWAKEVFCGVMSLYALTVVLVMTGVPAPIFNLMIVIASAGALAFAYKWTVKCRIDKCGPYPLWGTRVLALWFAVILIAEVVGDAGFAYSMFVNSVISMAIIAINVLFIYLLRGGIHWLFFSSPLWQIKLMRSDASLNERKVQILVETIIALFLLLPAILYIWGVFDSFPDALHGLFSPGFEIGGQKITVGLIIAALAALYGSFYASQITPKFLLDEQILGHQMDRGVRGSIGHLIRYFIIFVGLLLTFLLLGFNLTNLTIILSALGVGIGFGLQGIVNNFVCGLILLFERPIREGDTIQVGDRWACVKSIGMRATIIETFDLSEVVVPNADMINNHVTNWTLSNRQLRLSIPVGVDYGSDIPLVVETLLACAKSHATVSKSPAPEVLFLNLGDSSLDFTLRAWILNADDNLRVKSELYHEIVRRFREEGITIPFPQRDLHLYGGPIPGVVGPKQQPVNEPPPEAGPALSVAADETEQPLSPIQEEAAPSVPQ
jgi:small-conductance mechanosensitive channel